MSKFTVVSFCCFIVSACRFSRRRKAAKVNSHHVNAYTGTPPPRAFQFVNSAKATRIINSSACVLGVLGISTLAKISFSIVQSFVIYVVSFFAKFAVKEHAVHSYSLVPSIGSLSIETSRCFIPVSEPIPLRKPVKVLGIDNRILSLRKWNQTVGLVKRLNNCMAFHAAFHRSTSNGLLKFSRYSISFAIFFLLCLPVFGQNSVTISATVTDAGGIAWANGTYSLAFVGPANANWPGGGIVTPIKGTLDGTGSFSGVSVPNNATITPQPTFWRVTVCPNPALTTNYCFSAQLSITTTGSITSSLTPSAISMPVPTVSTQINPVVAYADAEISGGWVGFSYYNVTSAANRQCTAVSAGSCTTWQVAGGSAVSLTATSPVVVTPSPTTGTGVISCPTCFTSGSPPTLDQIGNPAAAKVFSMGANVPSGFSTPGTFTVTVANENIQSIVTGGGTGCNAGLQTIIGGGKPTDALMGCINTPTSGVTNGFNDGVAGYAQVNDSSQVGQFGKAEGVGVFGVGYCAVANTKCIGMSPQAESAASAAGIVLEGEEIAVFPRNTTDTGFGFLIGMLGSNTQPTGDNMPAVAVQTPTGTASYTTGFECQDGSIATSNFGICVHAGQQATGLSQNSEYVSWYASDGSAQFNSSIQLHQTHYLNMGSLPAINAGPGNNATYSGGWGITQKSTAALTRNQLSKIDTANADSVVVCTTADTLCEGFVASDGTGNGTCTAGNTFCPIVNTPGSVAKGILGTGTCAIGNWVIVDTTTNGDVKCTATQPRAWQGFALAANSSVGTAFDVLVSPGGSAATNVGTLSTATNCSSSASPAVCGSAAAGSIAVPTGTNATLVVNTTAVTANSQIFVQSDDTLGTKLGVTCNSTLASLSVEPVVSARTGGTSFTVTISGTTTTNPVCLSYFIVN